MFPTGKGRPEPGSMPGVVAALYSIGGEQEQEEEAAGCIMFYFTFNSN